MKKTVSYEWLRIFATVAVVVNHVCAGLFNNYSVAELGRFDGAFLNATYTLVSWGVPVFLMITGALLLNPEKEVTIPKIKKYILRMFAVLLTFGACYSVMELVFDGAPISIKTFFGGYLNMLEGKSWSHMWYVYMIISLYIITPALKPMIKSISEKSLDWIMIALFIGNVCIVTVNDIFGTDLYSYMQFGSYLMWYMMGYYLVYRVQPMLRNRSVNTVIVSAAVLGVSSVARYALVMGSVFLNGTVSKIGFGSGILQFAQSVAIFVLVTEIGNCKEMAFPKVCKNLCKCSFSIYLIHPVLINVLYKVLKFTPQNFMICLGIAVMFIIVFAASWTIANIMVRIPLLKKIV